MARDNFSAKVKSAVAKRSGGACSNPKCARPTSGPHSIPAKAINIGVAAHIVAAAPGGPRYDGKLSPEQRLSIEQCDLALSVLRQAD